jgi:hypothetical protein
MYRYAICLEINIPELFQRIVSFEEQPCCNRAKVYLNTKEYIIENDKIKEIKCPDFIYGDTVVAKNKIAGKIIDIVYHFERNEPMYYILVNGKKYKTRYFSKDLKLLKSG